MSSDADKASFNRKSGADVASTLIPAPPKLPEEVKERFPSLAEWERRMQDYMQKQVGKPG